jgi:uncharacterized membrane protein YkvA (DUF1232 family)
MSFNHDENLNKYAQNAKMEDINRITNSIDKMKKGPVAQVWDTVQALFKLVKDPTAAWPQKALSLGALIYLISPIDAVPDIIPVVGLLDDVGVITAAVAAVGTALTKYKT